MANIALGTSRARLNELKGQHAGFVAAAEAALQTNNMTEYKAQMEKAKALNSQIADLNDLVQETDRYDIAHAAKFGDGAKDLEEMGKALAAGERVAFDASVVKRALVTNDLNFSGDLVAPTGGGSEIHDGVRAQVSGLIDQVRVETFDGLNGWEEAYLKTMQTAVKGKPATVAGTARTASAPVFRKAKLLAHEVSTTAFVDKNITNLSPARYAAKVQEYALKAMRRTVNNMIINGDELSSHEFFGFLNATNTAGEAIYTTATGVTAIGADTLRLLAFGFGGDEEVAANARLVLDKTSLNAFAAVPVSANDNRPLYDIEVNGNTGRIKLGALAVPFTLASGIGNKNITMIDPMSYMLALFGNFSVRVDSSVKSVERQLAILGDVLVGGNLVADAAAHNATLT